MTCVNTYIYAIVSPYLEILLFQRLLSLRVVLCPCPVSVSILNRYDESRAFMFFGQYNVKQFNNEMKSKGNFK